MLPLLLIAGVWGDRAGADERAALRALQADSVPLQLVAIGQLAELEEPSEEAIEALAALLDAPSPDVRVAAADALRAHGPRSQRAADRLLARLGDENRDSDGRQVWAACSQCLGHLGPETVPRLIEAMLGDQITIRRGAALALHDHGAAARTAVPHLMAELKKQDPRTEREMIYALMGIGPEAGAAVPLLIEQLSHENFHVQYWSCRALGKIGMPAAEAAIEPLIRATRSGVASVRHNAATALGRLGPAIGREGVDALVDGLQDSTIVMRRASADALGQLGTFAEPAVPALEAAVDRKTFRAPLEAARAVWRISGRADLILPVLLRQLQSRHAPWEVPPVYAELGPAAEPSVPRLVALLDHELPETRLFALESLAQLGGTAAAALPELKRRTAAAQGDDRAGLEDAVRRIEQNAAR